MGNIKDFIDYILNVTKQNLTDEITIPDFKKKSLKRMFFFVRMSGCFRAEDGWLKNLKTLHRTSHITMKKANKAIVVHATMGIWIWIWKVFMIAKKFLCICMY
jgi:hypothetical protein